MAEEKEEKESFWVKFLAFCVKSPVTVFFVVALSYFAFQVYVLGNSPIVNKGIICGLLFLWAFWFLARNLFKVLLVLLFVGAIGYGYYAHTQQKIEACEASGGVWNKQTQTCEEKKTLWQQAKEWWQEFIAQLEESPEDSKLKNSDKE